MADAVDRAQELEDLHLNQALSNRRGPAQRVLVCGDCGGRNDRPDYAICSDCLLDRQMELEEEA